MLNLGTQRRPIQIVLFITLLVNLIGFNFFEPSTLIRIILAIVVLWVWIMAFIRQSNEPLIIITLFLSFFNLNNLYLGLSIPLWVLAIIAMVITSGFYLATVNLQMARHSPLSLIHAFMVAIACTETFLVLSLQPTTNSTINASRSVSAIIIFYVLWRLIDYHVKGELARNIVVAYLSFCIAAVVVIFLTAS